MTRAQSFVVAFLAYWFLLFLPVGVAGQANFRYLNKKNGLSQLSVFSIAQDSTGYVWFGTRDGLNKFDGNRFQVYRNDKRYAGLAGNDIRALYTDPVTTDLWVGTISGLSRYDADQDVFRVYRSDDTANSLWDNAILSMLRDKQGRFWVGSSFGLSLYDETADVFRRVNVLRNRKEDVRLSVEFLTENTAGEVFAGTDKGLYRLRKDGRDVWEPIPGLTDLHFTCGQFDHGGDFWLGTSRNGVLRWNPATDSKQWMVHQPADEQTLSNNRIRKLIVNKQGGLWVGTFAGLNYLPPGQDKFIRYLDSSHGEGPLLHNSIRSLLIDRSDKLWVGTYYGGIHHLDERYNYFSNFQSNPYQNSISANVVSSFAQDAAGDLWVGTEGGGLNHFQEKNGTFSSYQWQVGSNYTVPAHNIKALLMDGEELWVGTYRAGLTRFNTVSKQWVHYGTDNSSGPVLSDDNVYGLLRKDNLLWVLTYGGGLNIIDLTTNVVNYYRHDAQVPESISSDNARTILETRDGELWIGTDYGLNQVTIDGTGRPVRFTASLQQEKIYALAPASDGLWVGTFSGGLIYCDKSGKELRRYTTEDGLPDNSVFGILQAKDGALWLGTGNGLSRFDPQRVVFNNFNEANGLENLEFNFNAAYQTDTGDFLFGGINGFTRFNPTAFSPNENIPKVVFTRLLRNNEEVRIGAEKELLKTSIDKTTTLTFAYDEANFTVEFAALDYFSPRNNHYAYKLEGLDREWNYGVGVTQASYTIQREGNYAFLLRGGNSDGVWNPQMRRIDIRVLPPPWRSWWAYLLYFLLTALTIFGIVRFFRLRHKVQLQEIAQQQQDELMEMKLRFFTNITHEFRTPLTLILGPLEQLIRKTDPDNDVGKKLGLINRNAQRLLNLVNQVLTFRKLATDHEPMQVAEYELDEFIVDIFDSFLGAAESRGIRYSLVNEVGDLCFWGDRSKLEKVFFNLLSNAFKFTPDGGEITVCLQQQEDTAIVRVRDSGPGIPKALHQEVFKRFYEKSVGEQSHIKSSGIGLAISRKMMELHGGDIYIEDGDAPGAEFVVKLRLGLDHLSDVLFATGAEQPVRRKPTDQEYVFPENLATRTPVKVSGATLLVVDDNEEIRNYVSGIFSGAYRVITAATGKEGLALARQVLPALIISDVMMPEMDGMAFCHALKSDLEISHIPIILLTARSGQPFRIRGLRTGADDYLTKPFNPEELQLRVANILSNRQRFRESFGVTLRIEPSKVEVTSIDEQFLQQILEVAEQNVQDPDYKVDAFARDLAVSRTLLFNKLKALTGQTPSKFLKTFRMKRAAQLLEDSDYRIGKIASMVGFRDDRYFSDCFKKQFGVAPGQYRKNERVS